MSSLPQKPPVDPRRVKRLLETRTAREAFEILAARIILANERTQDALLPSRVLVESKKAVLTGKELEDLRMGRYGRIQLPSQEEARYWLKEWREGVQRGRRRMQERSQRRSLQR